jgi:hypothetical protein
LAQQVSYAERRDHSAELGRLMRETCRRTVQV